jgi:hypothetical protein
LYFLKYFVNCVSFLTNGTPNLNQIKNETQNNNYLHHYSTLLYGCLKSQNSIAIEKKECFRRFQKNIGIMEKLKYRVTNQHKPGYGERTIAWWKSIMIFVTEPFRTKLVKIGYSNRKRCVRFETQFHQKFYNGDLPPFDDHKFVSPVWKNEHAMKVSTSIQEWCGHVFMQPKRVWNAMHSYFESEGEQKFKLKKDNLEDEIWS